MASDQASLSHFLKRFPITFLSQNEIWNGIDGSVLKQDYNTPMVKSKNAYFSKTI